MLLPIRFFPWQDDYFNLPLRPYTVGYHQENHIIRPEGYSASQILITLNGKGRLRVQGMEEQELASGNVLFLRAKVPHEYYPVSDEPWETAFVSFHGEAFLDLYQLPDCRLTQAESLTPIFSIIEELWALTIQKEEEAMWTAAKQLYALLLEFHRLTLAPGKMNGMLQSWNPRETALVRVADYLKENFSCPIIMSELAKSMGYTQQHLNRLFKKEFGMNLHRYLQEIRLEKARCLLHDNPDMSIQEVATRIGLETGYFIRVFRRYVGITPTQFKQTSNLYSRDVKA